MPTPYPENMLDMESCITHVFGEWFIFGDLLFRRLILNLSKRISSYFYSYKLPKKTDCVMNNHLSLAHPWEWELPFTCTGSSNAS